MIITIFRPPTDSDSDFAWYMLKVGDINDCIALEINKYFCGVGTAHFTLPITSPYADYCKINYFLQVHDYPDDMYIIKNIQTKNDTIIISCYDLNAFLLDRLTLYDDSNSEDGTQGYDVIEGSTEYCIKHFVDYNLASPEDDNRRIPKLSIADNLDRGIADDKYMSRLDTVDSVVSALCSGANLGYRIKPVDGGKKALFRFDVYEQVDKTSSQTDRNRVIFSRGMRNIMTQTREVGITADKNSFYVDAADVITSAYKDKENIQSGFERREQYLSLSCDLEDVDLYAEKEISENYGETDSLEIEAGNPLDYRTVFDVGDIVTVYDKRSGSVVDSVISAVELKRTSDSYTVKVILGNTKPKLLDGLATKNGTNGKNIKDNVPKQEGLFNVFPVVNNNDISIGNIQKEVLKIQFSAQKTTYPILGATIQGTLTTAGTVQFVVLFDNKPIVTYKETYTVGSFAKALTMPIFGCLSGLHTATIAILSSDAIGKVPNGNSYGYILGCVSSNRAWDGTITIKEKIKPIYINPYNVTLAAITDNVTTNTMKPVGDSISEVIEPFAITHQQVMLANIDDILNSTPIIAYNDDTHTIYINFYNPVLSSDLDVNINALEITAVIGTTTSKLSIDSIELSDLNTLKINLPVGSITGGTVSIAYSNSIGNLVDYATGEKVADFVIAFNPVLTTGEE